ncbi:tapasin-related protein [Denticeps clupeoides]|uniref:Ig-like domain-containing protein n=1 Tax=Denticeps clupeoides TaxID=299321 RepID=A0AAY4A9I3_9TELE|nr:tapasin-related protein-like [Denticeps clupeoides]
MIGLLILGYLFPSAYALDGADVVLSCSYIEEGGGMGGMGGGSLFTRTPATLVIRDIEVSSDPSLEAVTPFNPPKTPNPEDIIFEVKGSSVEIPDAESLLHADCNEQEVMCEISHYVPRGSDPQEEPVYFIGSVQMEGSGISLTVVLRRLPVEEAGSDTPTLTQSKLKVPLSPTGTLLTEVAFVVFSRTQSVTCPLGGAARLDCGFRQQDTPPEQEVGLEWRLQHRGHGRKVLEMKAVRAETEEGPYVSAERGGSSADPAVLVEEGNASLTLTKLEVSDEGTYICTVSSGVFQTQQVVQLHITRPPEVSLSEERVVFQDDAPQKLSCHCKRYYPLDVQVEWLSQGPSEAEPTSLSEDMSLSSHRQHSDGTYSVTSHLTLRSPRHPPGSTITCRVSHQALDTPVHLTVTVHDPEKHELYGIIVSVLVVTVGTAVFYQVMR